MNAPDQILRPAHVIVLGNEKGGSGKSTTAVHLVAGLMAMGRRVATVDLDSRQGTLTRFVENRRAYTEERGLKLRHPTHEAVPECTDNDRDAAHADEGRRLADTLARLSVGHDVIVIDCPGSASNLSRLGHSYADTLVTPLNDSFVDLDVLARVDADTLRITRPSHYAEMAWGEKKTRAMRDGGSVDWVVMRNRLSTLNARNKRDMGRVLDALAKRIAFRMVDGFGERVIFRELFPRGLTLMDLNELNDGPALNVSQVAARQEVRGLIHALRLPVLA